MLNYEKLKIELQGIENKDIINAVKEMKNELCLKCGNYKRAHLGECEGCRWQ